MATQVASVSSGPQISVNTFINNPMMIPARVLDLLANQFLVETIFRNAGANASGLVSYEESTPLYLDSDVENVAEFAEIPVGAGQVGTPRIAVGVKQGKGIRVSREMRDEGRVDHVNRQITQLTNTLKRAQARHLLRILTDPSIPTIAAGAAWDTATGRPRRDIARASEQIGSAAPEATQGDDYFGFEPDTIVFPGAMVPTLMDNDNFNAVYSDKLIDQNIAYTGKLPGNVMGMAALKSRFWPKDRVLVLERGTVGFYSDTRPLEVTGLYPEGNGPNGGPTESWRSDATMKRVAAADQPKAACWITGVVTPA